MKSNTHNTVADRLAAKTRKARFPALMVAATLGVPALLIGGAVAVGVAKVNAVETHTSCAVTEKEDRALASLDKRAPRVYTSCGVFVVADELFRFHFDAADVYNDLQVGETVDLTTVGWRLGLVSWFPNVVEVSK